MLKELLPLLLISPLLVVVAYYDLKYMRIPNILSIAVVALFGLSLIIIPPNDLMMRLIVATAVFFIGLLAFGFRILGGGDVKILAALMLLVPVPSLVIFANVLSASLLLGVTFIVMIRQLPEAAQCSYQSISQNVGFPMGISIALAGIVHPYLVVWLLI